MTTEAAPAQLELFEGVVVEEATLTLAGKVSLRPTDDLLAALRLGRAVTLVVEAEDGSRATFGATVSERRFGYRVSRREGRIPVTKTRLTVNR